MITPVTNLASSTLNQTSIKLTWTNNSNATDLQRKVQRRVNGVGSYAFVAFVNLLDTEYTDASGLDTVANRYDYQVVDVGSETSLVVTSTLFVTATGFVKQLGGVGADMFRGVTTDSAGNTWACGYQTVGSFRQGVLVRYDPMGVAGTPIVQANGAGNVEFKDTRPRGSDTITIGYAPGANGKKSVVVRRDGGTVWNNLYNGTGDAEAFAMALDASGNVLVGGYFTGSITFGATTLTASDGGIRPFLVKLDGVTGAIIKAVTFINNSTCTVYGLGVDFAGNVVVAVQFYGSMKFAGSQTTVFQSPSGQGNIGLAKFASDLITLQWSSNYGSTGNDQPTSLAVGPSDEIVMGGLFGETINFGGGNMTAGQIPLPTSFVAKFTSGGAFVWSKQAVGQSTGSANGVAIAADGSGRVLVTGSFNGTANFGTSSFVSSTPDAYMALYSSSGTPLSVEQWGGSGNEFGLACAFTTSGSLVVVGHFSGIATIHGVSKTSAGASDAFVVRI